jgi:hypothetical protein
MSNVTGRLRFARPVHQHHVHRHAVEPGAEARLGAKRREALVHLNEHLLHEVFDVGAAIRHAVHDASDVGPVAAKELRERIAIAALAASKELLRRKHRP